MPKLIPILLQGILFEVEFAVTEYPLDLKSVFGTAHSSTTHRTNALITLNIISEADKILHEGYGEIGLPPLKPHCYLADFASVQAFSDRLDSALTSVYLTPDAPIRAFSAVPPQYFSEIRSSVSEWKPIEHLFSQLLVVIDGASVEKSDRAAQFGFEAAVFDAWSQLRGVSVSQMIFGEPQPLDKVTFYTVAMNDDLEQVKRSCQEGLSFTPYIKVKLDSNIDRSRGMLTSIEELAERFVNEEIRHSRRLTVDANSSWTPASTREFLEHFMEPYGKTYLPDISESDLKEWMELKSEVEQYGIFIYADESCTNADDMEALVPLVHGVNIKLEKCGGLRNALVAISRAKELGLQVWIGVMVGSTLSSSIAAQLIPAADLGGDMDGSFLVTSSTDKFSGGFSLDMDTGKITLPDTPGFGVTIID